jgi:hypothetical protein
MQRPGKAQHQRLRINGRLRHRALVIGYMRVSKADGSQVLDVQRDARLAAGVNERHLYSDTASGKQDDRPGFTACLQASGRATRSFEFAWSEGSARLKSCACLGQIRGGSEDIRFWHLADIDADDEHVCCWGKSGLIRDAPLLPLVTQTGPSKPLVEQSRSHHPSRALLTHGSAGASLIAPKLPPGLGHNGRLASPRRRALRQGGWSVPLLT